MRLFNTRTRNMDDFNPEDTVKLYTCGPTVYNYAHIGNLRTYLFEDFLKRSMLYLGLKVNHVMNITDVGHLTSDADTGEDKVEKSARLKKKNVWEIADYYTRVFKQNLTQLNILFPDIWCKATDYIPQMIAWIKKLEEKGYTYKTDDGIYYDTSKFKGYADFARLNIEGQKAGVRVDASGKKNPPDFALWKFSREKRQMEWESPWGKGFPGWHIECTAMASEHLGNKIDIHCGGIDHIPVHHTNEIAQAEPITGHPWVNIWMHGEFLVLQGDVRMGKSLGNFIALNDLEVDPLAYRYLCLNTHYRKRLIFSKESIISAVKGLKHLRHKYSILDGTSRGDGSDYSTGFKQAIEEDLNMPKALSIMMDMIKDESLGGVQRKELAKDFDKVFALDIDKKEDIPKEIFELAKKRETARKEGNFNEADRIRDELKSKGYLIEDTENGSRVKSDD